MIMDNLKAHKAERVRELIEARGCEVIFLAPYSPELNPIEEAFSKIKGIPSEEPLPVGAERSWRR